MIAVKTKMTRIPNGCAQCSYYIRGKDSIYERPACYAVSSYGNTGRPINPRHVTQVKTTKGRPKWCPLVEV